MKNIIGRQQQIKELQEALTTQKPEMVALVGRRRVGKTYLVREVYKDQINFELTGLQYGNKKEQLLNFVYAMEEYFPAYSIDTPPTSWLEAFNVLKKALDALPSSQKQVVFLDELPWLGTKRSGFLKGLAYFWNSWASKRNIVGYAFENVCLTHIQQIRKALSIAGMASSVASFIARPKDGLSGTQIDLLIDRSDQSINVCEVKFSIADYEVTKKDIENIKNKKRVFQYHTKTKKHLFTTLITTMGVINNPNRINHIDQVVILDDLFAP